MDITELCEHCTNIFSEPKTPTEPSPFEVANYTYERTERSILLSAYDGCHLCRKLLGVEQDCNPDLLTDEMLETYYNETEEK